MYLCAWHHVVSFTDDADQFQTRVIVDGSLEEAYATLRHEHYRSTGFLLNANATMPSKSIVKCPCGSGLQSWTERSRWSKVFLGRVCETCFPDKEQWLWDRRNL